jgi:O-antigen/teichoic acid export membrane protein
MKLDDQKLAKHSAIMVFSTLVASFFNYLYQLFMGRLLSPEDYGIFYSLLSLLYIITVGGGAIQTLITRYVSKLKAHQSYGRIRYLWEFSTIRTLLLGFASFLLVSLLSPIISQFLNINNVWYVILLASFFIFGFVLSVNWGLLIGLQKFIAFGSLSTLWSFLKLLLGISLVLLGLGVYGGLASLSLANVVVFILTLFFIERIVRVMPEKFKLGDIYSYSGLALLAVFSFTTMSYLDVILAKHYLDPRLAGEFAALAVLGKIIFFAPSGIALTMFPKTSESFEKDKMHFPILLRALFYTILIGGFVTILYFLFPNLIVGIMFGGKYQTVAPYMFEYGVAMLLFSVLSLLLNYFLSIHKIKVAYLISLALVIEILLLSASHSSIIDVTNGMLISGIAAIILMVVYLK